MNKKTFTTKSLFIRNLPKLTTNDDLINAFSDIGPIKRANVVTDEVSNNCIGVGYVTFAFDNDAEAALKRTVKIGDNVLKLKIANRKTDENPYIRNKRTLKNGEKWRDVAKQKKGKIIIRNLSFKADENCLRELFSKYGEIADVNIPKKENGNTRGFAFISFTNVNHATKAIKEMNAKKIVDRVVAIDYALPKKTFESKNESNDFDEEENKELDDIIALAKGTDKCKSKSTKEENKGNDDDDSSNDDESIEDIKDKVVLKNLSVKDKVKTSKKIKISDEENSEIDGEENSDNDSEEDSEKEIDSDAVKDDDEEMDDDDSEEVESNEDDDEEEESNDEEDDDDEEESDSKSKKTKQAKKKPLKSDVNEEKTVFIRNVSFDTTEDGLKDLLKQFGTMKYCKICIDEETGHSKGTAFVKFEKQEDAKLCVNENKQLENEEKFFLDGKKLEITMALSQEQLMKEQQLKKIKNRDKRNLYLSREGFIHPESNAANDVSQRDLEKRLSLENRKRKLLQNLLYFVSRTRLCIHNLPPEVNDKELKNIFYKAVNEKSAKIIEARVMYNINKLDNKLNKSAGYGFIEFTEHRHALIALRNLNNNPSIFKESQRPIVEFTIENLSALKRRKMKKKIKKYQENNQDQRNFDYEQLDKEIGEKSFMGFRARPMKEGEKIQLPKMNRKLQDMKQKINDLRKTKRAERKTKLKKKEKFLNLKNKHKNIAQHRDYSERKRAAVADTDEFEVNYLKRKRNFNSKSNEMKKATVHKRKKQRWFS